MAAKNTSKPDAKSATGTQKKSASVSSKPASKAAPKAAVKAAETKDAKPAVPTKKSSTATKSQSAGAKAPPKPSLKTAAKTSSMTSKKQETPAETPKAPEPAKTTTSTKKAASAKGAAKGAAKFPKGIFSPATGTATTDPFPPKDLEKFRTLIQELRVDNQDELEVLTEQLREMTSSENMDDNSAYSLHMAEQGTDAMEREKTFLQAQRTSDYIKKLDEALRRIQDSSFGICRICGLRLDNKRMMAVPVTQVCTYYKNTSKPCEPGRIQLEATGGADDESEA